MATKKKKSNTIPFFNFLCGKSPSEREGMKAENIICFFICFSCRAGKARSACGESLLCEAGSP